ncbi:MAG: fused MFS/spermidine synthase [Anaerolineaceae bacterium]|nr:fused MFS/spermidine synthase [Anaerolineaceae bacterium]
MAARRHPTTISSPLLLAVVFVSGMTTLGVEISASRLLGSFFGSSNIVWANIIGLMLFYLTLGYYIGGRWADRSPDPGLLFRLLLIAAGLCAFLPFLAHPVLQVAASALSEINGALALGSFFTVLLLFAVPITLLGCVSPFAIRLAINELEHAGKISGSIYAVGTLGSLLGTFASALVLIPTFGTLQSFLILAAALYLLALYGLWRAVGNKAFRWLWVALLIAILTLMRLRGPLRPAPEGFLLLDETESAYNYVQVLADRAGTRYLHLNEGQGVHSIWHPTERFFDGSWDFFLAAPYFNAPPFAPEQMKSLLIIGLAAGTIARQHQAIYGDIPMTGIELDGEILALAASHFELNEAAMPSLVTIPQDGRFALRQLNQQFDAIAIDAYRPPYIPWHLTTVEFFKEARSLLSNEGVLAINVGRTSSDRRLVDALAATLQQVFPSVHAVDVPNSFNSLLYASIKPTSPSNLQANLRDLPADASPHLRRILELTVRSASPLRDGGIVFTDDLAPVEALVDSILLRFLFSQELEMLRN